MTLPTEQLLAAGNSDVTLHNDGTGRLFYRLASPSWYTTWYDHQNLRDDRAEAFATQLQGGVYQYSYLASATTSGTFVAPPARAEQVYAPETFGRGATDRVSSAADGRRPRGRRPSGS